MGVLLCALIAAIVGSTALEMTLMHVEFIRNRAKEMPRLLDAAQVRTAKIWSCGFRSLEPLADCRNIEALEVLAFPGTSFDVIGSLRNLSYLRVIHFPHIVDLGILGQLSRLEALGLESLPSWDSSGKVHVVESLQPLSRLTALKHIQLFGVRPTDRSLAPLEHCRSLRSARFSKFPKAEMRRFYAATGVSDDWIPEMPVSPVS